MTDNQNPYEQLAADPDFGGSSTDDNIRRARDVYQAASPELRKLLAKHGLNNNPDLARLLLKASGVRPGATDIDKQMRSLFPTTAKKGGQ